MKIIVYTALIGPKSRVLSQDWVKSRYGKIEYICFTDQDPARIPAPWKVVRKRGVPGDPGRVAKPYKLFPFAHLPTHDINIWIDANMRITRGFDELIALLKPAGPNLVLFKHFLRDCIYDESRECLAAGLDNPKIINAQMQRYRDKKFPAHYGLPECGVMVRDNSTHVNSLMTSWWAEIRDGSRRDQLSFMYCVWRRGMRKRVHILDRPGRDGYYHQWTPHLSMMPLVKL